MDIGKLALDGWIQTRTSQCKADRQDGGPFGALGAGRIGLGGMDDELAPSIVGSLWYIQLKI